MSVPKLLATKEFRPLSFLLGFPLAFMGAVQLAGEFCSAGGDVGGAFRHRLPGKEIQHRDCLVVQAGVGGAAAEVARATGLDRKALYARAMELK